MRVRHASQPTVSIFSAVSTTNSQAGRCQKLAKSAWGMVFEEGMTMGAVTVPRGLDKFVGQIEVTKKHGDTIITGGKQLHVDQGNFFKPAIITNATASMEIEPEETLGPVLALFPFDTKEEAVKAADDMSMGLVSYCFTKNVDRTWRLFEDLEAGMIGMNCAMASAAKSPFGGIKDSGYGTESGYDVEINEYLIIKRANDHVGWSLLG
ncbi:Aldehyde/histidinol dehydrogenase [Xylaria sp. CBS 124048]|nr:Aldehyde/histidinol dehydrogenase [Xylaria sp. CBS 124048]